MPDINLKDYENVHNFEVGYGVDKRGVLCVVLTINKKHFIISSLGLKELIAGMSEIQGKFDIQN